MALSEFKFIYWWEWAHRFLGRFIGVAFAVPLMYFALSRAIERELWPRLLALFVLGGAPGRARLVHGGLWPGRSRRCQPVPSCRPSHTGRIDFRRDNLDCSRHRAGNGNTLSSSDDWFAVLIVAAHLAANCGRRFCSGARCGAGLCHLAEDGRQMDSLRPLGHGPGWHKSSRTR